MTISQKIKSGQIGVMPTDTIYGIVGSALMSPVVARIYRVRKRDPKKPFIVLISKTEELSQFGVTVDLETSKLLNSVWPGPTSVILPCHNAEFEYLHRGTKTIAFRLPNENDLIELILETGPLVAPSANLEGALPAETIDEAKRYFGNKIDFYVDGGILSGAPSKIAKIENSKLVYPVRSRDR